MLYHKALDLAREEQFTKAREAFRELTTTFPAFDKAWVSWAQMEKRCSGQTTQRFHHCREVLQRGLTMNPGSIKLVQAWGLMELQKGNLLAAVMMLERCAATDPDTCAPLLRWKPVRDAQKTVGSRRRRTATPA